MTHWFKMKMDSLDVPKGQKPSGDTLKTTYMFYHYHKNSYYN